MAGFFSLGGGGGSSRGTSSNNKNTNNNPQDPNHPNEISPETLFFYTRNQENSLPYNKGTFELWQYPPPPPPPHQQQQHLHPHHHHHQNRQNPLMLQDLYSLAIGSTSRGGGGGGAAGMNIYEDQSSSRSDQAFVMMGTSSTSSGAAGSTANICCQDCGNQAKKDCVHMRCRSCCKSRGFECTTHVKSTWVPAAKRRERHQQIASMLEQQQQQQEEEEEEQKLQMNNITGSCSGRDQQNPKRVKENNTSSRLPTSNRPSGLELASLPAEVNASAVFRCVRVSSIDNSEDQYAYQTALSIGGHTFKGILYDQGPEAQYLAGDTSSGGSGNIPQFHLTTATSTSSPATTTASAFLDNSLYPNSNMAGTHFFHRPPRS